jgi:hypothetical protein
MQPGKLAQNRSFGNGLFHSWIAVAEAVLRQMMYAALLLTDTPDDRYSSINAIRPFQDTTQSGYARGVSAYVCMSTRHQ